MANIKITVEGPLMDGHKVTFKAPCNCDAVEKLDVRYIKDNEQKSKLFTMKDSHGNDLTGLGNLFFKDAYVDVVLDPNSGSAYLQNAGTNAYLEEKFKTISAGVATPVDNLLSDRADLPLSARQGKILNERIDNVTVAWKLLGEITTSANLNLPTSYNELLIMVVNTDDGGNNVSGSYVIPKYAMDNIVGSSFIIPTHSSYFTLLTYNKSGNWIGYGGSADGSAFKKMVVFYR